MADIGSTLRETRIREKIDITAVEAATKIRAKYLRALENEEWGLLPGPAYVKSFLRTYAEFLGVDAHMLVEEYRARYEEPEELEVAAFTSNQHLRTRVRSPRPPSRGLAIIGLVLGLLAILFVLGITSNDGGDDQQNATDAGTKPRKDKAVKRATPAGGALKLSVLATRPVWVCLVDARGRTRIDGRTLAAGAKEGPFKSKRFRVTLGNSGGELKVNGKRRTVPSSPVPLGYAISASGLRPIPTAKRPTCAGVGTTGAAGAG
jgi:cytoskeleton protein RodZ